MKPVSCSHKQISPTNIRKLAHLFDDREYPRLAVVVTVGADSEIDLLWERICLVGCCELENAIVMDEVGYFAWCGVGAGTPIRGSQWYDIPRLCRS